MLTIRGHLITPFILGSMSVGLNILIRHSFMDLWVRITAKVPWPQLLSFIFSLYFLFYEFLIFPVSFPLGSLDPMWIIWKWSSVHVCARVRRQCCNLHYCLWRVSIKPRLSFSNLRCVLCFQRQSFSCLFIEYDSNIVKTYLILSL